MSTRKGNNPLVTAKNQFRGRSGKGNVWHAAAFAKRSLAPEHFNRFVEWVESGPKTYSTAILKGQVHYFSAFSLNRVQSSGNLIRELAWSKSILLRHLDDLGRFRSLVHDITADLFHSRFDEALSALDAIDVEFGLSLWALELRIGLLHQKGGLELHKQFVDQVCSNQRKGLAPFIAYWVGERNEDATNPMRFIGRFLKMIDESSGTEQRYCDYVRYKAISALPDEAERLAAVLAIEQGTTAIDLFELVVFACAKLLSENYGEKVVFAATETLRALAPVKDWRIQKLLSLYAGESVDGARAESQHIDDLLVSGQFAESERAARAKLDAAPTPDIRTFELAARALAWSEKQPSKPETLADKLLVDLSELIAKGDGWQSALANIFKTTLNFRQLPLFGDVLAPADIEFLSGLDSQEQHERRSCAASGIVGPLDVFLTPNRPQEEQFAIGSQLFGDSLHWQLRRAAKGQSKVPTEIDQDVRERILAVEALKKGDYKSCTRHAQALRQSSRAPFRREGARLIVYAGVKSGALRQALSDIAFTCVKQETARFWFSLSWILPGLHWTDYAECKGELALPIVLDLYLREVEDDQQRAHLRYAYEEFLFSNHIKRPSEIVDRAHEFPKDQLIYFLRNVAVPSVMDISLEFETSRQVDEERVRVCGLLTELDPANRETYEQEVFQVTKRFRIQDGLRRIDQSRLFVDIGALKRWADRELRDLYERYRNILKVAGNKPSDFAGALREHLQGSPLPREFLDIPSGQGDEVFVDLVLRLAREFLNNPEHGLEFFLSARIRHGSLSGHLRGPLEARNLVTLKDDKTGQYKPNEVWAKKIVGLAESQRTRVDAAFAKFANGYDAVIERLAKVGLQIKGPEKPEGMFTISFGAHVFHALKDYVIAPATTFDGFLEECFEVFWTLLRQPLEEVRSTIRHQVRAEVMRLFNQLSADIRAALQTSQCGEVLEHVSSAQTEVQLVLDRVADWFLLPDRNPKGAVFQMDQVVDIAVEVTKSTRRGFDPDIAKDVIAPIDIGSESLASINDCIFIMLDNVYRHSGISNKPHVMIRVRHTEAEGKLVVRVENKVLPQLKTPEVESKLESIRQSLRGSDYQNVARSEGGSGFFKLRRMASTSGADALSFGFLGEDEFFVEARLPVVIIEDKPQIGAQVI